MTAGAVLVLTSQLDPTADLVITELHRRGTPVFRCDLADFPQHLRITAHFDGRWSGHLATPTRELRLEEIRGAYYRRPSRSQPAAEMSVADGQWAAGEADAGFGGLLRAIPHWLNHPDLITHAEYKPVQLAAAAAAGLSVPRTLITNDPATAREFVAHVDRAVYKPFSSPYLDDEGTRRLIYTTSLSGPHEIDDSVRHTAHLFQEWVDKAYEVRLTVVDQHCFAARLVGRSQRAAIDWRSDYPAIEYGVVDVPDQVQAAVHRMLHRLGLRFAAMDFVVRPDGEWMFLDLNPNGQWAWIEHETGLPICSAIVDALLQAPPDAQPS